MEDAKIVELYLNRDETAIKITAEKYGAKLRYLANNLLDDLHLAEECENDTYLKAWDSIPPHTPYDYLFSYLARITRHIALDMCKARNRQKRNVVLVELTEEMEQCMPATDDVEKHINAKVLGASISTFLSGIPQQQRDVFLRRYWYFDSVSAIAKRFGISESKTKATLFRTRKHLREYLKKEGFVI